MQWISLTSLIVELLCICNKPIILEIALPCLRRPNQKIVYCQGGFPKQKSETPSQILLTIFPLPLEGCGIGAHWVLEEYGEKSIMSLAKK